MRRSLCIVSRYISGVTGTTTTIIEHAARFRALDWKVRVYGEKVDEERLRRIGAETRVLRRWPLGSILKRRLFAWRFERELARLRRAGTKFDLVCGHGDTLVQDVLSLHNCVHAAHEAVHGQPLPARSGVGRVHSKMLSERRFRLLIANSQLMAREVEKRFGVPRKRIKVIHPGHDPSRFNPEGRTALGSPVRARLGLAPDDVLVGLITSGDFAKRGVTLFLDALSELPDRAKRRVHVLIIGRESRLAPYRARARRSGLGRRIIFRAPVPDVERYYHALDVYVHPALYEEFGQSVQEAMACGVPVVTTDRVGASELLRGEARRMILKRPEKRGLADAMSRLILSPGERTRWGELGRRAAARNTWDENFRKTLAAYEKLI